MKVFIGFGYNPTDTWIIDLVFPLVKAFGCEVLSGEEIQGQILSVGVIAKIDECDALIGFMTKRDGPDAQGKHSTHHWVIAEIGAALAKEKSIFVLREKGVDPQPGIAGDRQKHDFEDKSTALVEVAKFISNVKSQLDFKTFLLLPEKFSKAIRPYDEYVKCTYKFFDKGKEYEAEEAKIRRHEGSYGIIISKIPSDQSQVQIKVDYNGGSWSSDFISVGQMRVHLQKKR